MRDRFPLAVVGGVLVIGGLLLALVSGAERGMFSDELSTFRAGSRGSMALPLLLRQQGLNVLQRTESFEHLDGVQTVALLGLDVPEEDAWHATIDGGVLSDAKRSKRKAAREHLTDDDETALLAFVENGGTAVVVSRGHEAVPLADRLDVVIAPADEAVGMRTLVPAQPHAVTTGLADLEAPVSGWLELPDDATVLIVDSVLDKPVVASLRHGTGQVVFISSAALAQNALLKFGDNAAFWVNLAREFSSRGAFVFDEFHHGFVNQRSVGSFLARYGFQFAVLQLVVAAALWALSLRRFGRVRQTEDSTRTREADLLSATSRLYREGRHHAHAAMTLKRHALGPLIRRLGLGPSATDEQVTQALQKSGHAPSATAFTSVVTQLRSARSDDALLRAAARLHAFSQDTAHLHATGATRP